MKNVDFVRKNSNLKNKKGITLIALIITIIVLLILAGVTIITLTGENGILKRASNAAEVTQKETAKEKMNFKITNIQINTYAKEQRMPTLQEIADEFYKDDEIEYVITKEEVAAKEKIDVTGYSSIFTKLEEYPYEFEIDSSLRLASINGVKVADTDSSSDNTELLGKINTLESTIAEMQEEIKTLKSGLQDSNNKITSNEQNIENLQGSAITKEILYEGTAGAQTTTYTISDISKYKYIIIYSDCLSNNQRCCRSSRIISVSDIIYNNSTTFKENTLYANSEASNDAKYYISYWFKSSTQLYTSSIQSTTWTSPRIYKIEGII